jgi:hypothetical protein
MLHDHFHLAADSLRAVHETRLAIRRNWKTLDDVRDAIATSRRAMAASKDRLRVTSLRRRACVCGLDLPPRAVA